jgi:hypothetical protein
MIVKEVLQLKFRSQSIGLLVSNNIHIVIVFLKGVFIELELFIPPGEERLDEVLQISYGVSIKDSAEILNSHSIVLQGDCSWKGLIIKAGVFVVLLEDLFIKN